MLFRSGDTDTAVNTENINSLGIFKEYEYIRLKAKYGWALAKQSIKKRQDLKYISIYKGLYGIGDDITLDMAKCLFKFPRKIEYADGVKIAFCYGSRGFYLKSGKKTKSVSGDYSHNNIPDTIITDNFKLILDN